MPSQRAAPRWHKGDYSGCGDAPRHRAPTERARSRRSGRTLKLGLIGRLKTVRKTGAKAAGISRAILALSGTSGDIGT